MSRWSRALALTVATLLLTPATLSAAPRGRDAQVRSMCAGGGDAASLNRRFAAGVGAMVGADYQRVFPLPDGRRLWMFQDAFVRTPGGQPRLLHNAGLVQTGACFRLLRSGTAGRPRPWIGADRTRAQRRWFWPLGGTVARDGTFRLFVAEMVERGPRYLSHTEPVATWMATIALPSLRVVRLRRAPDASRQLYGWSVVDHGAFTYLYGHCHRQFGWGWLGHDRCTRNVKVARVPRGRLGVRPTYWTGRGWSRRAGRAASIAPRFGLHGERRTVNPMQFARAGRQWIAVTKVGDWWGDSIYLDRAPSPVGPWRTAAVIRVRPLGPASTHTTYFASFVSATRTSRIIGVSNNRWDGMLSGAYRPTFLSIPITRW